MHEAPKGTVAAGQRLWPIGPTTAHLDELDVDAGYCPAGCTTAQHEDVALCPAFVMMRILLHGDIARPWAIACSDESCETVFCTFTGSSHNHKLI